MADAEKPFSSCVYGILFCACFESVKEKDKPKDVLSNFCPKRQVTNTPFSLAFPPQSAFAPPHSANPAPVRFLFAQRFDVAADGLVLV